MLLPLFGLLFGIGSSASVGAVLLALHPRWKLTWPNIAAFVAGSFTAVIGFLLTYNWFFVSETQTLRSGAAVVGFLAVLAGATLLGGTLAVFLRERYGNATPPVASSAEE